MRFGQFNLSRYGHFTDEALSFTKPDHNGPDLHIVVGPNEAGKSTFRSAVVDFIYGIDVRSPFNFKHDYRELLIEATVENGAEAEALQRTKGNRNTLRRTDGQVYSESELLQALSGIDKDAYKRQFALDHETLVEGGRRLLANQSDLSALLFEAASGISDFAAQQRDLLERAGALWKRDSRSRTAFRDAHRQYQEAERAKREAVTTAPTYTRLQRAMKRAEAERDEARQKLEELERERAKLERLRRTAPIIARMDEIERSRAELVSITQQLPRFPADAGEKLAAAREKISVLSETIRSHRETIERLTARHEALDVDESALSAAEAIELLVKEAARIADFPDQINRRRIEIENHAKTAREEAKHIGWSNVADLEDVKTKLPPALHRQQLNALIASRDALKERLSNREQAASDLETDLQDLDRELSALASLKLSDRLAPAMQEARRLGDVDQRHTELAEAAETSAADLNELMEHLSPWSGTVDALRSLVVLSDTELEAFQDRINRANQELETQGAKIKELTEDLVRLGAELEARREAREIVEQSSLLQARQTRDARWGAIRDGRISATDAAADYETLVKSADELADKRFSSAEAIARVEQLDADLRAMHAQRTLAKKTFDQIEERRRLLDTEWADTIEKQGLRDIAPSRYRAWADTRRRAIEAAKRSEAERTALKSFNDRVAEVETRLRDSLISSGIEPQELDAVPLTGLSELADDLCNRAERIETDRSERLERKQGVERRLAAAKEQRGTVEAEWREWVEQWTRTLTTCQLPAEVAPSTAADALDRMATIEDQLKKIEEIETERIFKMRRDLDVFKEQAFDVASRLAGEPETKEAIEIAEIFKDRLLEAREAASNREQIDDQRAETRQKIKQAETEVAEIQASLEPMFEDAAIENRSDYEQLKKIIDTSARLDDLDTQQDAALKELNEAADGVNLETLRSDLADMPVDGRESRMQALMGEVDEARELLEVRSSALTAAQTEFEAVTGGDIDLSPAAAAEEDRQQAIAALGEVTSEYIDTFLKARLLRWAIDRFREENQSPLVHRAEALFRLITGNRFSALVVDVDSDEPALLAKRSSGELLDISGLSDGTRDQLFMALRLAAAELQIEEARPLPFIADDLFVNFDDERALEGFRALAQLGMQTQVLYLSHHEHLIPLAKKAVPEGINIVRLTST